MNTLYFDWSYHRGVVVIRNNAMTFTIYKTLADMLNALTEPTVIIGESTFASYDRDEHAEFIKRCADEGHKLFVVPTRGLGQWRKRLGFGDKPSTQTAQTDFEDAQCIRARAKVPGTLKPVRPVDEGARARRETANQELMHLRRSGELVPLTGTYQSGPRKGQSKQGYERLSDKDAYARKLVSELPAFSSLPEVFQLALTNSKSTDYNLIAVAAVGIAAKHALNRRDFENIAGLSNHGYPSQIRADLHHWVWAGGNPRPKLDKDTKKRKDGLTFSQYRRSLRWLYSQLKSLAVTA